MTVKAIYFSIEEYVPPHIFEQRGDKAWELIDPRLIRTNDLLRSYFGTMIINTWHSESLSSTYGRRSWSGFRTAEFYRQRGDDDLAMFKRYDRSLSQHKFGRASDALFRDTTAAEVREYILKNPSKFPDLTAIEDKVSWFHGDVRNTTRIKVF